MKTVDFDLQEADCSIVARASVRCEGVTAWSGDGGTGGSYHSTVDGVLQHK